MSSAGRFITIRLKAMSLYLRKRSWLYCTQDTLEAMQLARLKSLLHRFSRNRYYGDVMQEAGLDPLEIHEARNVGSLLSRLPVLTKEDMQRNRESMLNRDAKGIMADSSGGSTGAPLNFFHDENWLVNMAASTLVNDTMQGWYFFRPHAKLWGSPKDVSELESPMAKLLNHVRRRRFYDSFDMSFERMMEYHEDLTRFRPEVIFSYASSIYLFAEFLSAHGINPSYPSRSIISTAERLDERMRERIGQVFNVPVYDRYGSREVGCIGGECGRHRGMHLHMYDHVMECIDPLTGKPLKNEPGELVVTDLNNFAFPFIRYRIGDQGILSDEVCGCGRNGMMLKKVLGRSSDTITTRTGRLVHGEYFTHAFYAVEGISRFQFVQEGLEDYTVLIVRNESFREESLQSVLREIRKVIGDESDLDVRFVDRIPAADSGKHRFTISKVPIRMGAERSLP